MGTLEERATAQKARIKQIRDATAIPMVLVSPRDEIIRKTIAHMPNNIKFPAVGPAKWPLDTFTQRRIADGDVTIVSEEPEPEAAPVTVAESSLDRPW